MDENSEDDWELDHSSENRYDHDVESLGDSDREEIENALYSQIHFEANTDIDVNDECVENIIKKLNIPQTILQEDYLVNGTIVSEPPATNTSTSNCEQPKIKRNMVKRSGKDYKTLQKRKNKMKQIASKLLFLTKPHNSEIEEKHSVDPNKINLDDDNERQDSKYGLHENCNKKRKYFTDIVPRSKRKKNTASDSDEILFSIASDSDSSSMCDKIFFDKIDPSSKYSVQNSNKNMSSKVTTESRDILKNSNIVIENKLKKKKKISEFDSKDVIISNNSVKNCKPNTIVISSEEEARMNNTGLSRSRCGTIVISSDGERRGNDTVRSVSDGDVVVISDDQEAISYNINLSDSEEVRSSCNDPNLSDDSDSSSMYGVIYDVATSRPSSDIVLNVCGKSEESDDVSISPSCDNSDDDESKWQVSERDLIGSRPESFRYYKYDAVKNVRCKNCQEKGHLSRDCPKPKVIVCYLCGKRDHVSQDCPYPLCYNCSKPGHISIDCDQSTYRWFNKCTRCNMPGHQEENCPDTWRRFHLTIDDTTPKKQHLKRNPRRFCSNCGSGYHFAYECNKPPMFSHAQITYPFIVSYDDGGNTTVKKKKKNKKMYFESDDSDEPFYKKKKIQLISINDTTRKDKKRRMKSNESDFLSVDPLKNFKNIMKTYRVEKKDRNSSRKRRQQTKKDKSYLGIMSSSKSDTNAYIDKMKTKERRRRSNINNDDRSSRKKVKKCKGIKSKVLNNIPELKITLQHNRNIRINNSHVNKLKDHKRKEKSRKKQKRKKHKIDY